nr:ABC transporter permease [Gemmatimonadaceae bacterium]
MGRYLLGRLLQTLAVVLLVTSASFVLVHLAPGDPFATEDPRVTEEMRERWRAEFGLDRPLGEQYVRYIGNAARGNLGFSFSLHRPVAHAIADALPRTLLLVAVGGGLALLVGIALGVYQAMHGGTPAERTISGASLLAYSLPDFWVAII